MKTNTFRGAKAAVMAALLLCCMALFSACGAVTYSELTVDSTFSGKRVIVSTLSNSDLSDNVTGGADSIEGVVKKYIPDCMTYTKSMTADSLVYKFTIDFNGIDDYRSKISAVMAADPDYTGTVNIEYENVNSPFKSSLYLKENVSSVELLGWLRAGLEKEEVVTYSSTSDWFESDASKITFDGEEITCYGNLEIDKATNNCASAVDVSTYFLSSGNFDRVFKFTFYNDTVTKLSEKNFDIKSYFAEMLPEGGTVDVTEDDNRTVYILTAKNLTQEQLVSLTSNIMGDESTAFSVTQRADVNKPGRMIIDICERLNASIYLEAGNGRDLSSSFYVYDGAENADSGSAPISRCVDENGLTGYCYQPYYVEEADATCSFTWDIRFEDIGIELDFSPNKVSDKLKLTIPSDLLPAAMETLHAAVEKAVPEKVKLTEENGDGIVTYTVDFGNASFEEAASRYKEFIYNYTGEKVQCTFGSEKCLSGSPFYSLTSYSARIDMSALTNDLPVKFTFVKPALSKLIVTDNTTVTPDEEQGSNYTGTFTGSFDFGAVSKSTNIVGIIALCVLVVSGLVLIVLILANIGKWLEALKGAMPAKAERPVQAMNVQAMNVQPTAPVAPQQPVQTAPQETAAQKLPETAEQTSENNDEEEFI